MFKSREQAYTHIGKGQQCLSGIDAATCSPDRHRPLEAHIGKQVDEYGRLAL